MKSSNFLLAVTVALLGIAIFAQYSTNVAQARQIKALTTWLENLNKNDMQQTADIKKIASAALANVTINEKQTKAITLLSETDGKIVSKVFGELRE